MQGPFLVGGNAMFYLNGIRWHIRTVRPESPLLIDRTGTRTVATTDPVTHRIYLSRAIRGEFKNRVLVHELGHATMFSFDLLADAHRMVPPEYWIEMEEWICNFIADYGWQIFCIAEKYLGDEAVYVVPPLIERMIA